MEKVLDVLLSKIKFLERRLDVHMREVVKGTAITLFFRGIAGVFGFCFNLLIARTYGAQGTGIYFLAITIAMISSTLGCLGMGYPLLRIISANAVLGNWGVVKGVYNQSLKMALSVSIGLIVFLFLTAPWVANVLFHKPDLSGPLRIISFSIAPLSFISLQAEALRGLKRIQEWIIISSVSLSGFSLFGIILLNGEFGVDGVAGVYVVAALLSGLIGLKFWRKSTPLLQNIEAQFNIKELVQSSEPMFFMNLLDIITNSGSIIFLGIWATKADLGIYGTSTRIASFVAMILIAVNSITAPKFASLYKNGEMKTLSTTARQTAKITTILAGPILGILILFPRFILGLFGSDFKSGALVLAILAAGQFVNVATGSVGYLLMMSGHEKLLKKRAIFMAFICIILNILLIPHFGILGAAIASSICLATTNLIATYLVWSKLGIFTIPFLNWKGFND